MISLILKVLFGFPILLIVFAAAWLDGPPKEFVSLWFPFLGRMHPAVLHLPIGLLMAVLILELPAFFRPTRRMAGSLSILIGATYFSSAVAAACGALLSWEGGYAAETLAWHKWGAVVTTAALFLAWIANRPTNEEVATRNFSCLGALGLATLAMMVTGHAGGSLTHGATFLTKYLPFDIPYVAKKAEARTTARAGEKTVPKSGAPVGPVTAESALPETPEVSVYTSHIQPLFTDYCVQCHGEEKVKGKLRMDSFEQLMRGGENGEALVARNSAHSALIERMLLPTDDEDRMPPTGKPQPSAEALKLLAWWIDQGASATATLAELTVPAELAPLFIKQEKIKPLARAEIQAALAAEVIPSVFAVRLVALDSADLAISSTKATDDDVERLLAVRGNITQLDLGRSPVTDRALEAIGQMINLQTLRMDSTKITDAGVAALKPLGQLNYLNLNSTGITDRALTTLRKLKLLQRVYLWGTGVTADGVQALHAALYRDAEAEKLRLQIAALEHTRDSLRVEVVANVVTGPTASEAEAPKEMTISDIMKSIHEGKGSKANLAPEGKLSPDDLNQMLELYELMVKMTPPKGAKENFQALTGNLITATKALLAKTPGAEDEFKQAVDCRTCHSQHRN